jgi:hypothetical protein
MSNFPKIEYFPTHKTFCGVHYHLKFPDEWINDELPNTGRECYNCVGANNISGYAMWRGIILGYCANCAKDYDYTRGRGFIGYGLEKNGRDHHQSAFNIYLGEIDWSNYGDLAMNPDHTLENREVFQKQECEEDDADTYECSEIDDDSDDYFDEESECDDYSVGDEYFDNADDSCGECLHIGCSNPEATMSAYCTKHQRMYES